MTAAAPYVCRQFVEDVTAYLDGSGPSGASALLGTGLVTLSATAVLNLHLLNTGAYSSWGWWWKSPRARVLISLIGKRGAQVFYTVIGLFFVAGGA